MKNNKKLFIYKNRIILTNGSLIKLDSSKYIKNYQININLFKKTLKKNKNIINNNKLTSSFYLKY